MNIEKLEHSRVKITTSVSVEEFKKALDKSFEVNNAKVTIQGFRKGKAPRSVYEKNYGVESLFPDALDVVFNKLISDLYKDNKELAGKICGQFIPEVEDKEFKPLEKDFEVSLTVDVYPEVTLGQYKDLEAKALDLTVSDEELNQVIEALLAPKAEKKAKEEQVIANGDFAKFDFKGFVNDEAFEGGEATNYELKIGSGQFIPGFEDQMVGMKAGETKDVLVKFPENYGAANLAGQDAKFVVTVHEVLVNVLPELNDEFVKTLNIDNVSTVEELRNHKLEELKARKETSEKDRQVNELIQKVIDNATVDLPQSLIDERINGLRAQYENQAKLYNIPFDTFLSLIGSSKEQFEAQCAENAKAQALFNVVISELIEVEKLAPTKEALDAEIASKNIDTKKDTNAVARIYSDLAYKAVVDFLLANAKLV